ncbi:MAG: outer membrane protein assembly factor BamD [Bacteroidales bacterium]|nr:outer membrane protein assembly factor BamD [Bacteroidales bacterium]
MKRAFLILYILVAVLGVSCSSKHKKLLESNDQDAKFEAAMKAYERKDYFHATQLFENLLLYSRGREKAELVNLYYGKSLLGGGDYYSAAYQFESFVKWFPYSKYAEEALFQAAYCKYLESPEYSLDQTLTKQAIDNFQSYIDKYPKSDKVEQANKFMDELREKLIKKDYTNAYNYYKTEAYQAAQTSLKNFLNNYPDATQYREDAMYYIVLAGYEFAEKSIESKQKERYEIVLMDYERYQVVFSNMTDKTKSEKLEGIYNNVKKKLETINTTSNKDN